MAPSSYTTSSTTMATPGDGDILVVEGTRVRASPLALASWLSLAHQAPLPSPSLLVRVVYGGRDITDATTRKRREGPAILDPVLTLQLGEQKFKTEIIRHSSDPVWQQRFELYVSANYLSLSLTLILTSVLLLLLLQ